MKAAIRSLYGVSDRRVWILRTLRTVGDRRRRLWPNPTKLEVTQYRAMDWREDTEQQINNIHI